MTTVESILVTVAAVSCVAALVAALANKEEPFLSSFFASWFIFAIFGPFLPIVLAHRVVERMRESNNKPVRAVGKGVYAAAKWAFLPWVIIGMVVMGASLLFFLLFWMLFSLGVR